MKQDTLTVAHWAENLGYPLRSLADWVKLVDRQARAAARKKADILLMPEHTGEHWMHFAPNSLQLVDETRWIAEQAAEAMPAIAKIARKHNIAILAGSTSWRHEKTGKFRNRAWMFFPDRKPVFHDKLVMTPSEKDPCGWDFESGSEVKVFKWRGFRLSMVICLDIEMPHVAHKMASADIDLLLVPSMTVKKAGYHRVYSCARARAVELMTAVVVVGNVGAAKKHGKARDIYRSGAATYIPSEEVFGHTGIFANMPLHAKTAGAGKILYSRDIPVGKIRALRHSKPEAWPGPFDAKHVKVINNA
jgi:predicted amidohydrolase